MNLKSITLFLLMLFSSNCLPDEKNWQEQRFEGITFYSIQLIGNTYIIEGANELLKTIFFLSIDGLNWNRIDTSIESTSYTYLNGEHILIDSDIKTSSIYRSTDLINWSSQTLGFSIYGLFYNGSNYIGYLLSGTEFVQSSDLLNWSSAIPIETDISLYSISYLNNKFYASGNFNDIFNSSAVFYSTDSIHWNEILPLHGINIGGINYISNELIFTGDHGALYKKENGNWVNHSVLFGPNFGAVARGRNEFVFLGGDFAQENPVLWSTNDFFTWRASQHDIRTRNHALTLSDDYTAWYSDVFYTGDFYIVTANECLNGNCEGIILTAE